MNASQEFYNWLYIDAFLFVAGIAMTVIGIGYAIVEWVGERLTNRREQL